MKVVLLEETYHVENNKEALKEISKIIESGLESTEYIVSHLTIDGTAVYHNIEVYIEEKVDTIEAITIHVHTKKQMVNEFLLSIEDYVERATPKVKELSESFYNVPSNELWDQFTQLLEGINWLYSVILIVDKEKVFVEEWSELYAIAIKFEEQFPELLEAVESKDNIVIADILQYEIIELFETIKKEIKSIIDVKGERTDVN